MTNDSDLRLSERDRVRLPDDVVLEELRQDLVRAAYQRRSVDLDSGLTQPFYFDKYLMIARPAILRRVGRLIGSKLPLGIDRVAAPALGAVSVGTAVSLESGIPLAVVRTHVDPNRHVQAVEGGLYRDEAVALIEDVVATGARALAAVEAIHAAGARVVDISAVIDCEQGAADRFEDLGIAYRPLFGYSTLLGDKEP